jgi:hypothetical protein
MKNPAFLIGFSTSIKPFLVLVIKMVTFLTILCQLPIDKRRISCYNNTIVCIPARDARINLEKTTADYAEAVENTEDSQ